MYYNSKKGFLFIEGSIMVLIAGAGIISAALFPSLTSYLARGRDTARITGIKEISTALMAYQIDNSIFPTNDPSGCITGKMIGKYLLGKVPKDPVPGHITPDCNIPGSYSYRTAKSIDGKAYYVIGAEMESSFGGNSSDSIGDITPQSFLRKGDGKNYFIVNTSY